MARSCVRLLLLLLMGTWASCIRMTTGAASAAAHNEVIFLAVKLDESHPGEAEVHRKCKCGNSGCRPFSTDSTSRINGSRTEQAVTWALRNANGSIDVPARVPGAVHLDLLDAGVLDAGDPYFGVNELLYSWVALTEWTYRLRLPRDHWLPNCPGVLPAGRDRGMVSDTTDEASHASATALHGEAPSTVGFLSFEEIDTFAVVRLNGQELGRSSNQFMPANFVIRDKALSELLQRQTSTLEVTIVPALSIARARAEASAKDVPDSIFFQDWAEPAHRNFARKAAADYGWDWGPAFVPAGLSGDVSLTVTNSGRLLEDVTVTQDWTGTGVTTTDGLEREPQTRLPLGSDRDRHPDERSSSTPYNAVILTITAFLDGFERLPTAASGGETPSSPDIAHLGAAKFSLRSPAGRIVAEACSPLRHERKDHDRLNDLRGEEVLPVRAIMRVSNPQMWWPRGLGAQRLYVLEVKWYPAPGNVCSNPARDRPPTPQATVTLKIGLRHVELVKEGRGSDPSKLRIQKGRFEHQDDRVKQRRAGDPSSSDEHVLAAASRSREDMLLTEGVTGHEHEGAESFFFRVNGVDVFAKGSNWVPADAWRQRVLEEQTRWRLESVASGNMNMVRVWGGGRRQPGSFYSVCDELGLMVWQDLPYACALYPTTMWRPPGALVGERSVPTDEVWDTTHDPDESDESRQIEAGVSSAERPLHRLIVRLKADKGRATKREGQVPFDRHAGTATTAGEDRQERSARAAPGLASRHAADASNIAAALGDEAEKGTAGGSPLLDEAAAEARAYVRRLSAHPSVVCWGGNNEVEQALGWFNESIGQHRASYQRDYVSLFIDTIQTAVQSLDPFTPFVDSSPSNGNVQRSDGALGGRVWAAARATESEGHGRKRWGDPNNPDFGDVHFYDYDMDCEDSDGYPRAGFVSEHGVQSFPSLASYEQVLDPGDRWLGSPALRFRQRHENGDDQISRQMRRHFELRTPPSREHLIGKSDQNSLRAFFLLSQIQQGRCLETAIYSWRTNELVERGSDHGIQEEHRHHSGTMGVLYWQLGDMWQGPSWSTVEYDGSWKASHYFVRRAFRPTAIAGVISDRRGGTHDLSAQTRVFRCYVVSDVTTRVAGIFEILTLTFEVGPRLSERLRAAHALDNAVRLYLWDDNPDPVASWSGRVLLPPSAGASIFEAAVDDLRAAAGQDRFIVHMMFRDDDPSAAGFLDGEYSAESVYYVSVGAATGRPLGIDDIPDPDLSWEVISHHSLEDEAVYSVRVRARAHAPHTSLRLSSPGRNASSAADEVNPDESTSTARDDTSRKRSLEQRARSNPGRRRNSHELSFPGLDDIAQRVQAPDQRPSWTMHASDAAFHALPGRAYDVQVLKIRCRARECQRGSHADLPTVEVESLRELLTTIDAEGWRRKEEY